MSQALVSNSGQAGPLRACRRPLVLLAMLVALGASGGIFRDSSAAIAGESRRTPLVKAVEKARPSVVNIRGQKLIGVEDPGLGQMESGRRVNGMGTGVIIDPRGYIVTNYHVVDGVAKIQVTLADGSGYTARLVSRDPSTDMAIIKIDVAGRSLPVINVGTSSDLMVGETVIAVGNAYGYEHTVTSGIISALHRPVQVSEAQSYHDLIQTDASINPGNSGGPLLNIDGEMIGLNVAVRVGAQGIGFALPVDKVMQITSQLLSVKRIDNHWHGVVLSSVAGNEGTVVEKVEPGSPAAESGLKPGDVITAVARTPVARPLDFERALLGRAAGEEVQIAVRRERKEVALSFILTSLPKQPITAADRAWDVLGLRLDAVPADAFRQLNSRYRGGLEVTEVRPDSPAEQQGVRRGDILVGMHQWETISSENVTYVLTREELAAMDRLKFYILRDGQTLYGHFILSSSIDTQQTARK